MVLGVMVSYVFFLKKPKKNLYNGSLSCFSFNNKERESSLIKSCKTEVLYKIIINNGMEKTNRKYLRKIVQISTNSRKTSGKLPLFAADLNHKSLPETANYFLRH